MNISYDSEKLITELEQDIAEFGKKELFFVWIRKISGQEFIVNYDFMTREKPIIKKELKATEKIVIMQADLLMEKLIEQNNII